MQTQVAQRLALAALIGMALGAAGCSGDAPASQPGAGGAGGTATVGGTSGTAGSEPRACPEAAELGLTRTGRLEVLVRITVSGVSYTVGEAATGASGRQYRLSLFKFFLSQPVLVSSANADSQAQFLAAEATPMPYGLHLVDADDSATHTLRLAAELGSYTALRFGVGVPAACNGLSASRQVYPLNPDSDMFWTWGSQFMFVRIEGSSRAGAEAEWAPFAYHMGFDPAFANVRVEGVIAVADSGTGPALSLDIDRLLAQPSPDLPPGKHAVPEGWIADNLEANQVLRLE